MASSADVVVVTHAGLDGYPRFVDLARNVPLPQPIHVAAWRVKRADIPAGVAERTAWLDRQWLRIDAWVHDSLGKDTGLS